MKALIHSIYLFIFFLSLSAPATVQARHSSSQHSAARRSLHRRAEAPGEIGVPPDNADAPSGTTILIPATSISLPASDESSSTSSSSAETTSLSSAATSASVTQSESVTAEPSVSSTATASDSESLTSAPPSSSTKSTTDIGGGLSSVLSSILSSILDPPTPSSSDETSLPTTPPSSTSEPSDTPTPPPPTSESITPSASDTGITLIPSSIQITLPSSTIEITIIPSSSEEPPPPPSSSEPPVPPSSDPPPPPPSSTSEPPVPPSSTSEPPVPPSSTSEPPVPPSSSESISFPDGSSTSVEISTSVSVSVTTVISIPSELSFILSETSLAQASLPTLTATPTLTDPDQATTTVDSTISFTASSVPTFVLPEGIPNRIYPNDGAPKKNQNGNKVMISILYDKALNWPFVVSSNVSASQIFGYMPIIIGTACGIPANEVENWALQVNVPAEYAGPADQVRLGTVYLAYVDPSIIDTLAAQIKATSSPFYNGVQDPVARQLASHVVSGFNVQSVEDPNEKPGSGASNSGATGNNGKQRQDAIIGVVSALGAVAVLVLVFLVFRSLKRRRELAHRRLSDPPDAYLVGARPEGREFDQDSVGGQRRRSFYFAEDSLRDSPQQQGEYYEVSRNSPSPAGMRERRVIPNVISAPVLKESSMNW